MSFRSNFSILPLAGLLLIGFSTQAGAQNRASQSASDELLVRWKSQRAPLVLSPSTNPSRWQQSSLQTRLNAQLPGAAVKRTFAASGWSLIKVPAGQSTASARAALIKALGAANVSLNYRRHATRTPNDPSYGSQWQWPKIKAPDAWNNGTGTRDVVVAVLDSGIDLNHVDIQANLWRNTGEIAGDGVDNDGNGVVDDVNGFNGINPGTAPQDENGHGTHCAGLVGAVGNNSTNVTGVNWSVKIMALRFLDAEGSGYDDDAIACFEYAIKMKQQYGVNLRVISNSYAGPDDNPAFKEAYQAAENAGILNVCAAGNDGTNNDQTAQYPANYSSNTNIAVAATDQNDALASFSNYGQSVDIAAPGVAIPSLQLGGGVLLESGTSMATPIVAGAAALVSSLEPALAASALKNRLLTTVDAVASLSGKVSSGGRLNLARAVTPVSYEVKGQVYRLDGTKRVAIPSARIVLSGKASATVASSTTGGYSFSSLAPGTYTLTVTLKGYTFNPQTLTLPQAGGATTVVVDFGATSVPTVFYTLFGTARDTAGAPVSGVSIALNTAPTTILATTDASGKYSISNRPAGTYTLKATGGNYKWSAVPGSIAVPDSAVAGKAEVNFQGVLLDKTAPAITISTPASGATFAPGNQVATGLATDASGVKEIYLELTRFIDFKPSYYNWTTRLWDASRSNATTLTRPASGKSTKWSATLPSLSTANYSLRVWGRDTINNISRGEADAFSTFSVVKPSSARSSAGES